MNPARILCWFGWHDWRFTLNFVQEPTFDSTADMYPVGHYSGECKRCGERDLFRGPAPVNRQRMKAMFSKEMQRALEADGEKLRQLTGEDHGPVFLDQLAPCPECGGDGGFEEAGSGKWSVCRFCDGTGSIESEPATSLRDFEGRFDGIPDAVLPDNQGGGKMSEAARGPTVPTWEYRVLAIRADGAQDAVNFYGRNGWELVAVSVQHTTHYCWLKRRTGSGHMRGAADV